MDNDSRNNWRREAVAVRLEAVRHAYGRAHKRSMPRSVFSKLLNIEGARYRRYERGELSMPLEVLAEVRALTGVSLDWLLCADVGGPSPGGPLAELLADVKTLGAISAADRLRFARETQAKNAIARVARMMRIPLATWRLYERGTLALPLPVAEEFAHRFSVSLDYLYRGELGNIAATVREKLLAEHPELSAATESSGTDNPTRGAGTKSPETRHPQRSGENCEIEPGASA